MHRNIVGELNLRASRSSFAPSHTAVRRGWMFFLLEEPAHIGSAAQLLASIRLSPFDANEARDCVTGWRMIWLGYAVRSWSE